MAVSSDDDSDSSSSDSSFFSTTSASVVRSSVAMDAAFCSAVRTTFVGSITPAFSRSSYFSVAALKPMRSTAPMTAAVIGRVRKALLPTPLAIPARGDRSVQATVETAEGKRTAYVDPHTGQYLGQTQPGGVMGFVKRLHSLDIAGPVMNLLVEVVAGWAIVLVATGIFLWWPRGQTGGVVTVRSRPAKRLFWRDLHAVTGAFASGVILFLAVTVPATRAA